MTNTTIKSVYRDKSMRKIRTFSLRSRSGSFGEAGTHYALRTGFTLIELLVVITIISLLVSILVPSLTKAKDLAQSVVCQSNMHSISLLYSYYLNDYKNVLPGIVPSTLDDIRTIDKFKQTWQYKLKEYENWEKTQTFDCPSIERNNHGHVPDTYGAIDYAINSYYSHEDTGLGVEKPINGGRGLGISASEILLLVDSTCSHMKVWSADPEVTWHISQVHNDGQGANVLHLDLHVEGPAPGVNYMNGEGNHPMYIYPDRFYGQ